VFSTLILFVDTYVYCRCPLDTLSTENNYLVKKSDASDFEKSELILLGP
jgi:hypothetical protein